jgi:hypothetical protein
LKLQNESIAFQTAQAIREADFSLANVPYKGAAFGDGSGRRKLVVPFGKGIGDSLLIGGRHSSGFACLSWSRKSPSLKRHILMFEVLKLE